MRDWTPWVYIFNMKEKIKGFFFLIRICNYVHGEHMFDSSGHFSSTDKSVTVAGSWSCKDAE